MGLPIALFLRNRLKYALNAKEVETIMKQRLVKIDGRTRTDVKFPCGFQDVVQIDKTGENFRLLYDAKGRFIVHRITAAEAKYKLCRVRRVKTGPKNVPFLYTTDGRTIRYPDPITKVHDTIPFDTGNLCMVTGGRNTGRVGTIMSRERHPGSFDIVHVKDQNGHLFATRLGYIFVIGKGNKPYISLPKGKGIKLTIAEERDKRLGVAK